METKIRLDRVYGQAIWRTDLRHYIGRQSQYGNSALANPFSVSIGREKCVRCYEKYFNNVRSGMKPVDAAAAVRDSENVFLSSAWRVPTRKQFKAELDAMVEIAKAEGLLQIDCYCTSQLFMGEIKYYCHGEIIAAFIMEKANA